MKIKFRAISIFNKSFVYGYYKCNLGRAYISDSDSSANSEVDASTVCQFTGIYDSKQVEIYDKDILMIDTAVCVVQWNEELAAFCIRFKFEKCVGCKPLGSWKQEARNIIKIGDMFNTPELLEN